MEEAEAFIPYLLDDLVEMCLSDDGLPLDQHQAFEEFASFFCAMNNFVSHQAMSGLDRDYACFNPDIEVKLPLKSRFDLQDAADRVASSFREMAENANYRRMTVAEIEESFGEQSLIKLNTAVDLDAFSIMECWVRGSDRKTHKKKNWRFQEVEHELDIWRRVLLLMRFKEDIELSAEQIKQKEKANIPYEPGKIYLYQYKDVPKSDLEILFPNVRVSMNLKDRIMLGVPAVAATIGTFIKFSAQLVLIIGAIAWVFFKTSLFDSFDPEKSNNYQLAIVALTVLGGLGALFFKQYTAVKNKRISFLKEVSEHLFFRNIAMNKAVLDRVIDDGEEEDCKEAVLIFYHLLANRDKDMNREQLDKTIEKWMAEKFETVIDFDIDGPVEKLKKIVGKTNGGVERTLLTEDAEGNLHVPDLCEAKEIMDYNWDNAFSYSQLACD